MKKSSKFSLAVRERGRAQMLEPSVEYSSMRAAIQSIAPQIEYVAQTLHEWVRKHEVDTDKRDGVSST